MRKKSEEIGLGSPKLGPVKIEKLNETHFICTVVWCFALPKGKSGQKEISAAATYLLCTDPRMQIVCQIDHEALMKKTAAALHKG